jgi:hypothetical protein
MDIAHYQTWQEAHEAAVALGATTREEYYEERKRDSRLPSAPQQKYPDEWDACGRWGGFLGRPMWHRERYSSLADARAAALRLGIRTAAEYWVRYREDPQLPSSPHLHYGVAEWKAIGGWHGFLRDGPITRYTYEEAQDRARALGIRTEQQYRRRYREDPRLYSRPDSSYRDVWRERGCWPGFLGTVRYPPRYQTMVEASSAAQALGIRNGNDYNHRRASDPLLPANPAKYYDDWRDRGGWRGFLGRPHWRKEFYETLDEARSAVMELGVKSVAEYRMRYREDPLLPSKPQTRYGNKYFTHRGGWRWFLGIRRDSSAYPSLTAASRAAQQHHIISPMEYRARYRFDHRLPRNPRQYYGKNAWERIGEWDGFLGLSKHHE